MRTIKAADLFCGAGGSSTGLKRITDALGTHGITVKPSAPIARLSRDLDLSRHLLRMYKSQAALILLANIEKQLEAHPDGTARYRMLQQRGAAYLQLRRPEDAREFALKALDHNQAGVHALMTAAFASLDLGDEGGALGYAERAIAAAPDDGHAWAALVHVRMATERDAPAVPPRVSDTVEYRAGFIQVLLNRGRVEEASVLIDGLLAEGQRTADLLVFKAQTLMTTAHQDVGIQSPEAAEQIERLTTEAIDEHEASDYMIARALLARAMGRRALGRLSDADADMERAHHMEPEDPGPVLQAAQTRMIDGDFRGAVQLLSRPGIERFALLIAIRAEALAHLKESAASRKDLEEALRRLSDAHEPNAVRLAIADAAIELGDVALSERTLAPISGDATETARYAIVRGRIAFAKGDVEGARAEFERAAERERKLHDLCYAELGSRLVSIKRWEAAVQAFERAASVPAKALPQYVLALIFANQFVRANEFVMRELERGEKAPDWALEYAAHIAIAREDLPSAVQHLARLAAHDNATPAARLQLASLLLQLDDRAAEARPIVTALADEAGALPPDQQMAVSRALYWIGDHDRAMAVALRAYRAADDDPEMHRAFASLALHMREPIVPPDQVGPDTYVRLKKTGSDVVKEYVVLAEPPYNTAARQISILQAQALHLWGLKINDTTSLNEWLDRWEVVELKPASLHIVQDIIAHFADRFADAPFFVKGFSVSEGLTKVSDFAPMIMMLHQQDEQRNALVRLFREHMLPLGVLAERTGTAIPDAMSYLRSDEGGAALFVEWADRQGQEQSVAAAFAHNEIVLTESGLETAQRFALLDQLAARFTLYAPHSLRATLRSRLDDAHEIVEHGRKLMSATGPGLQLHEWPAGHPDLVRRRDALKALLDWIDTHVHLEPRPLASVVVGAEESSRDVVGHSSFDSVALASSRGAAMYADDLGLRRIGQVESVPSFSTPSLLIALAQTGTMSADDTNERLGRLSVMRYTRIPLSLELLKQLVRSMGGSERIEAISANLAPPAFTPLAAGRLGAQLLKWATTDAILPDSLYDLAAVVLTSMASHWPRPVCAHALLRAAVDEMSLLPVPYDVVKKACVEFSKVDHKLRIRGDKA